MKKSNFLLISLLALFSVSCQEKNDTLKERFEEAIENTEDAIEDVADYTEDAIEDTADKLSKSAKRLKKRMEKEMKDEPALPPDDLRYSRRRIINNYNIGVIYTFIDSACLFL